MIDGGLKTIHTVYLPDGYGEIAKGEVIFDTQCAFEGKVYLCRLDSGVIELVSAFKTVSKKKYEIFVQEKKTKGLEEIKKILEDNRISYEEVLDLAKEMAIINKDKGV